MSVQDVPADLGDDDDDPYQPITPTPAARQLPPGARTSAYGVRVSMAPDASTRRTTWMGERDSRLVPEAMPSMQRRASSGNALDLPAASSARNSRTLTPSDVPFAAVGPQFSTPARPKHGHLQELHISLPDPDGQSDGLDSRASTISSRSKRTTGSTYSSFRNDDANRVAPAHPTKPPVATNGPGSESWLSLSTRESSLAQSSQHSLLSKPSLASMPSGTSNGSPSDTRSVTPGQHLEQGDAAAVPLARATTTGAAPPQIKLDFGADTSSFFGDVDFFGDLGVGGGLASTLGSGLGLGSGPLGLDTSSSTLSGSLASSQRTVGLSFVSADSSVGPSQDSPSSIISPADATGSLSALAHLSRVAHLPASSASSAQRPAALDLPSRSRTPSVPASPSIDSHFSGQQTSSSAGPSRLRSFDLDDSPDVATAMKLSPELQQARSFAAQQQRLDERSRTSSAQSTLAYQAHRRHGSGSGSGASASSEGRPASHRRVDSLTSARAQSPLAASPQSTPHTGTSSSNLLDFMVPASLKRRRSNASLLNAVSNAGPPPASQPERAKTESPQAKSRKGPQYGSINKSLPPTPRHVAPPPREGPPPPSVPSGLGPIAGLGINSGSLRKSAVIALKKSKGLLRTKASKTSETPMPSANPYSADDTASIASSIDLPIQMPASRPPESPSLTTNCFPRGPGSVSRSSSSIFPRESNESKRSATQPPDDRSFTSSLQHHREPPRKSQELLRRSSDASPIGPIGPRPLLVQPVSSSSQREAKAPEPRALPRQPSTDQLLMLATAKLQALVNAAQAASATSNGSSRESFPLDAAAPWSEDASGRESSASSPAPADEPVTVAKVVRVHRGAESPTSPRLIVMNNRSIHGSSKPIPLAESVQPISVGVVPVQPAPRPPPPSQKPTTDAQRPPRVPEARLERSPPLPAPPEPEAVAEPKLPVGPYWVRRQLVFEARGSTSAALSHPWDQLEYALQDYRDMLQQSMSDRQGKVTSDLLPFLKRVEAGLETLPVPGLLARRQRDVLFGWLETLLDELKDMPSNRGVCLEGVAAIVETRFLAIEALAADPEDAKRYHNALVAVLAFAIDRLNEKAVYANTLAFSGRMLALAFFRIEGIGLKLLRLLPQVKRLELRRIVEEAGLDVRKVPEPTEGIFPQHLDPLCFRDLQTYCRLLSPMSPNDHALLVSSDMHSITMSGNWLIRWSASDSDLPFAFYRAYHRQLVSYLQLPQLADEANPETFLPVAEALTAPGYLFLAASLLEKAESLIHRNMRSVTTLGPNSGTFNTLDSATLSTGAKPKVLEMANRRVVSTMLDIVGGPAARPRKLGDPAGEAPEGQARRRYFGGMLQIWVRAVVKRTSLFDARGIFLLLDFLESLFFAVCSPTQSGSGERDSWKPSVDALLLFDVPFVLSTVQTVLTKADNTVGLMRTVAFLYSLFDVFTMRVPDREQLCDNMLLQPELFQRLFLFWNTSVRGYFQRLVVWRLSRLGQTSDGRPPSTKDPWIFQTLQTLNLRLEAIRKRHNELDPLDDLPDDDDLFENRRLSVSSTRGVTDQPWAVEELKFPTSRASRDSRDARPSRSNDSAVDEDDRELAAWNHYNGIDEGPSAQSGGKGASKVVNWLKITLNTAGRKAIPATKPARGASGHAPTSRIDPFALDIAMPRETVDTNHRSLHGHDEEDLYPDMPSLTSSSTLAANPAATSASARSAGDADELAEGDDGLYPQHLANSPGSFFKFEFETEAPQSDSFDARKSTQSDKRKSAHGSIKAARRASIHASARGDDDADSIYPGVLSPGRKPPSVQASPRVSKRFSKRTSILPPPAFDLLFETSEPVPAIPAHFRSQPPYDPRLHPYAVRGLREYEESLDELEIWLVRVKDDDDEDLADRDLADLVPRLGVAWPVSFDE